MSGCVSGSERKAKRTTEDLGLGSGYWDWMFGAVGFETGSHALVVDGLGFLILLFPPPQCWGYRRGHRA